MSNCIDLCFLGLFDFGHSNFYYDTFYLICLILAFLVIVYRIIKKPKDITNYYLLLFMSCSFPLIDYYHVSLFLALFFLIIFSDLKIGKDLTKYALTFILVLGLVWTFVQIQYINNFKIVNYKNLELMVEQVR